MNFDVTRTLNPGASFRAKSIIDRFSIDVDSYTENFTGSINLPDSWNVGLIVGRSGTGKTTIAKELFPDEMQPKFLEPGLTVMDSMPEHCSVDDITKMFNAVGFSSPPSWLKPYNVLSNGEKMRVDLAFALLSNNDITVFDEFTSVVDRQVAQIASYCTQKAVRKRDKKFIAVGCHYDVEDWLMPDWTFCTDTMTFTDHTLTGLKKNRPAIKFEIVKSTDKKGSWGAFAKYHYLSHVHNNAASVYLLYVNDCLCGFYSVLNFPHPKVKKAVRGHRLIVFPDYQGMGFGIRLRTFVADLYVSQGYRFFATTTNPALIHGLKNDKHWKLTRAGRTAKPGNSSQFNGSSSDRYTTSWEYKR